MSRRMADSTTDEQRADDLHKHDVFETGDFEYIGVAEAPRRKTHQQLNLYIDQEAIERLKRVAGSKGMGYQTLARMWLLERLEQEI